MDQLLVKASHGEAIHFSELLRDIPSDEILANLFFDPEHPENNGVSQFGLEVLKLRLEGYKLSEIADRLRTPASKVAYWSRKTRNCLLKGVPDCIDVDIPALRRLLHIRQTITGYTKLSELLQELPSDDELCRLDRERGNLPADPPGAASRRKTCTSFASGWRGAVTTVSVRSWAGIMYGCSGTFKRPVCG